jgi:uncharacterized protein (DUF2249 family)
MASSVRPRRGEDKERHYQFQFEQAGQFTWNYREEGPEVWRVEIGRVASESAR